MRVEIKLSSTLIHSNTYGLENQQLFELQKLIPVWSVQHKKSMSLKLTYPFNDTASIFFFRLQLSPVQELKNPNVAFLPPLNPVRPVSKVSDPLCIWDAVEKNTLCCGHKVPGNQPVVFYRGSRGGRKASILCLLVLNAISWFPWFIFTWQEHSVLRFPCLWAHPLSYSPGLSCLLIHSWHLSCPYIGCIY